MLILNLIFHPINIININLLLFLLLQNLLNLINAFKFLDLQKILFFQNLLQNYLFYKHPFLIFLLLKKDNHLFPLLILSLL